MKKNLKKAEWTYFLKKLDSSPHKNIIICLALSLLIALSAAIKPALSSKKKVLEKTPFVTEISTFIPRGMTLVPMTFANKNSLEAVVEKHSYVTIYETDLISKKKTLLARSVKLIRSPKNPDIFAILVNQEEASRFIGSQSEFTATLQPSQDSKAFIKRKKIIYLDD